MENITGKMDEDIQKFSQYELVSHRNHCKKNKFCGQTFRSYLQECDLHSSIISSQENSRKTIQGKFFLLVTL